MLISTLVKPGTALATSEVAYVSHHAGVVLVIVVIIIVIVIDYQEDDSSASSNSSKKTITNLKLHTYRHTHTHTWTYFLAGLLTHVLLAQARGFDADKRSCCAS